MNADDLKRAAEAAYASDLAHGVRGPRADADAAAMRAAQDAHTKRCDEFAEACKAAGPGGAVELSNGHRIVVGEVNVAGGVCDDCQFDPGEGVTWEVARRASERREAQTQRERDIALALCCEGNEGKRTWPPNEACEHCVPCLSVINEAVMQGEEDEARERERRAKDAAFDARLRDARTRPVDSMESTGPREDTP